MKIVFDIGTNVGRWSLANMDNYDQIISVEPSPGTFTQLKNNCGMHDKIVLLNYAVCHNDGKDIPFYECHSHTLSTLNKEWLTSEQSRFYGVPYNQTTCPTISIDSMIEKYGMPDLIKIDVEGGEFECVSSLTTKTPLLCFEWAAELDTISFKCLDYLSGLGYTHYYIQKEDNYTFRPDPSQYNE